MKTTAKLILIYALPCLVFLLFLAVFMEVRANERLNKARGELASERIESSITYYFQALNWYSPIGSSQKAAEELGALGASLLEKGDTENSYQAFLRLRSGLNASRSFYFPKRDLLEFANRHISNYLASKTNLQEGEEKTKADLYFELYQSSPKTNEGWYLTVVLTFILWAMSGIKCIFTLHARGNTGVFEKLKSARYPLFLFALSYALWIVAMGVA
jgi:hypothetical protein